MKFGGITKLTLLDYPEHIACTLFTAGCNLRCPFCHNGLLVCGSANEPYDGETVLDFLCKRRNVLEGVCLSGGEPLLQNDVGEFLSRVKELGYKVKLDTNGTYPDKLRSLVDSDLVDYVAMDIKNSPERYAETCGRDVNLRDVAESVRLLMTGKVDYEFRTTVTGTFHTQDSIRRLAETISGAKRYFLQQFVHSDNLIDGSVQGCSVETLKKYRDIARQYVSNTQIRGVDAD